MLNRLHREFNVSVAEIDYHDAWQDALVACVLVSNDAAHTQRSLRQVVRWIETSWPDVSLVDDHLEML